MNTEDKCIYFLLAVVILVVCGMLVYATVKHSECVIEAVKSGRTAAVCATARP